MKRLDQLLSNLGVCTRRETRYLIRDDRIVVAGELAKSADQRVNPYEVLVDDEPLDHPDGILIALHKPVGYICTHDGSEGLRIYDLLPVTWQFRDPKVVSIGRLDKDTSGLILVTDQTELVHRWTSPKTRIEKVYHAVVDKPLQTDVVQQFASGLQLRSEDDACLPAQLVITGERHATVTICEGRYHQVRRMFAACGYRVEQLHRAQLGDYQLDDLPVGEWRDLDIPKSV